MGELFAWGHAHIGLALFIILTANAILTASVILLENREPEKSMAWFLALFFIPFLGFVLYLFFGHDWHKRSYKQRRLGLTLTAQRREEIRRLEERFAHVTPLERTLRLLDANLTGQDPTEGNRVTILTDAHEKYPRLLAALRAATHRIDIEYYLFRNDGIGKEIIAILKERAHAGVAVRFLIDGMGSLGFGAKRFLDMRAAGISCHYFSPLITLFYFLKANYRDHRKIVVIDDAVAFTGGINIGDEYLGKSPRGRWRDTSVELHGPCVAQLTALFEENWHRTTHEPRRTAIPESAMLPAGETVDIVASGPDSRWHTIHQQYLALIHQARRRIRIQTPYFIPDESLSAALTLAALRGVDIEIMLPHKTDWPYLRWVAHTYLEDLLRAGVRVYEYQQGFLHTKAIIVDDVAASVGTCNVDIRSLRLDFEVNLLLTGTHSIRHLTEDFERDLIQCEEIRYGAFIERPLRQRVLESIARLISPLL
ncbi:MAG: cardiolipin synthase [Candidatus Parcubacteria bacterium]|jgi:cardiolipin synthase